MIYFPEFITVPATVNDWQFPQGIYDEPGFIKVDDSALYPGKVWLTVNLDKDHGAAATLLSADDAERLAIALIHYAIEARRRA